MFSLENWQIYNSQEQARRLRPAMDALSYVFVSGYASTQSEDIMKGASFLLNNGAVILLWKKKSSGY